MGVFFGISILIFLILYFGHFKQKETPKIIPFRAPSVISVKKIRIDFSILENPILKELQLPPTIEFPLPEEIGKENPFSQSE